MPGGKYGPGGKWIHDRAHGIMDKRKSDLIERYGEKKGKSIAYALATQQAHKVKKSPKGFRTPTGVRVAKAKHDKPMKEYRKTAGLLQPAQPRAKDVIKGRGPEKRKARAMLRDKLREGCPEKTAMITEAGFMSAVGSKAVGKQTLRGANVAEALKKRLKIPQNLQQARKASGKADPFVHQAVQRPRSGTIEKATSFEKESAIDLRAFFDELENIEKDAGFLRKALLGAALAGAIGGGSKMMGRAAAGGAAKAGKAAITQQAKKAPKATFGEVFKKGYGGRRGIPKGVMD